MKKRTTVSVEGELIARAKKQGLNVSGILEKALEQEMSKPKFYHVNTNKPNLPEGNDGTKAYDLGITVTHGPIKYGKKLGNIDVGDYVLSYVSGVGYRAVGKVIGRWSGESVDEGELRVSKEHKEYQLPTEWIAVVEADRAVGAEEFKRIAGFSPPSQTHQEIKEGNNPRTIAELIVGRARGLY